MGQDGKVKMRSTFNLSIENIDFLKHLAIKNKRSNSNQLDLILDEKRKPKTETKLKKGKKSVRGLLGH
jgi:hypothetical protein